MCIEHGDAQVICLPIIVFSNIGATLKSQGTGKKRDPALAEEKRALWVKALGHACVWFLKAEVACHFILLQAA